LWQFTEWPCRSVIDTHLMGESVTAIHESLSLDRFRAPWVLMMLPFRMPRAWSSP
jgi:carotenoid 1,2-hydratase